MQIRLKVPHLATIIASAALAIVVAGVIASAPTPEVGASGPPSTPSSVTVTRGNGTVTATWLTASGATKYHVTYSSDNKQSWTAASDSHAETSITINIDASKAYIVAVRAGNANGWSSWRNSAISHPPQKPATPAAVTVTRSSGTLEVSGYTVTDATKYHVTYSANDKQTWQAAACGANCGESVTITGVEDSYAYTVGVRAGNGGGWSSWRNSAKIAPRTQPPVPPTAPASVNGKRVCDHRFNLHWPAVHGATSYDVNVSTTNRKSWKRALSNVKPTNWEFSVWSKNKTYVVAVRAKNAGGDSPWTNSKLFAPPPCAVSGLSAVTSTTHGIPGGSITATWDAGKRASGYNVNYRADGGQWQRAKSGVTATTHTFTVTEDKMHTVAVQSVKGSDGSEWRNYRPPWFRATDVRARQVTLKGEGIKSSHKSEAFYIYYKNAANECKSTIATHDGKNETTIRTLTPGTTYSYSLYPNSSCVAHFATANFTTPAELAASDITSNGATLTLTGHSGAWHYKADKGPHTSCSSEQSGPTATLSSLSSATPYVYRAYSDAGCSTQIGQTTFVTGPYVSNLHHAKTTNNPIAVSDTQKAAIGFTTGNNPGGYTLNSVTIRFDDPYSGGTEGISVSVQGAHDNSDNTALEGVFEEPNGETKCELSGDNPNRGGEYTFTCSTSAALSSGEDYFVVISGQQSGAKHRVSTTTLTTQENEPSGFGWAIHDRLLVKNSQHHWDHSVADQSKYKTGLIKVSATAK